METISVDEQDWPLVTQYRWFVCKKPRSRTLYAWGYRRADGPKSKKVYLHRLITGEQFPEIDHIDGNGLNCCRENLRPATHSENIKYAWAIPSNFEWHRNQGGFNTVRKRLADGSTKVYRYIRKTGVQVASWPENRTSVQTDLQTSASKSANGDAK